MAKGKDIKRTALSMNAMGLAMDFKKKFFLTDVSGYAPFVQEPPETTGGGAHARQSLVLTERDGDGVITIGWVNVVTREGELRTFDVVRGMHRVRFPDRKFDIEEAAFDVFFNEAVVFFEQQSVKMRVDMDVPKRPVASLPPPPATSSNVVRNLFFVVGVLSIAMLIYILAI